MDACRKIYFVTPFQTVIYFVGILAMGALMLFGAVIF